MGIGSRPSFSGGEAALILAPAGDFCDGHGDGDGGWLLERYNLTQEVSGDGRRVVVIQLRLRLRIQARSRRDFKERVRLLQAAVERVILF